MQPDALGILENILEAIEHIEEDTNDVTYESFLQNRRVRELVQWNFTVIGEAAYRLRRRHPEIADRIHSIHQIIGFRNAIIHGYDRIDYPTVWQAVEERLLVLKTDIRRLIDSAHNIERT